MAASFFFYEVAFFSQIPVRISYERSRGLAFIPCPSFLLTFFFVAMYFLAFLHFPTWEAK